MDGRLKLGLSAPTNGSVGVFRVQADFKGFLIKVRFLVQVLKSG